MTIETVAVKTARNDNSRSAMLPQRIERLFCPNRNTPYMAATVGFQ